MSVEIRRAADRYRSQQPGITTWNCFSAGAHYDPANVSFGDVIGVDEHAVAPGAGFDWHAHRGVTIASWVLSGALLHEDDAGHRHVIAPGELFVQHAGDGIRHRETNASTSEQLRFIQTTLLGEGSAVSVERTDTRIEGQAHVFVARGTWEVGDTELSDGDSARVLRARDVRGEGELLVVRRVKA